MYSLTSCQCLQQQVLVCGHPLSEKMCTFCAYIRVVQADENQKKLYLVIFWEAETVFFVIWEKGKQNKKVSSRFPHVHSC